MKILTANRLLEGDVVYWTHKGWVPDIAQACKALTTDDEATLLAIGESGVAKNEIVDAYLMEVMIDNGTLTPTHYREALRASGPSIQIGAGKRLLSAA